MKRHLWKLMITGERPQILLCFLIAAIEFAIGGIGGNFWGAVYAVVTLLNLYSWDYQRRRASDEAPR